VLPKIQDFNLNDTVNITVSGMSEFMKFFKENQTLVIMFDKITEEQLQIYPIKIQLKDDKGGSSIY